MALKNFQFQINMPKGNSKFTVLGGRLSTALFFLPGALLLAMALLIFLAPTLVLTIAAGLLVYFGALLCIVAFKFIQLRNRIKSVMQQVEVQAYPEDSSSIELSNTEVVETEGNLEKLQDTILKGYKAQDYKKIILH